MRVVIGGSDWTITVTDGKAVKELRGCEGLCQSSKHQISINRAMVPPERFESVLFHEVMHASVDMHEARYAMQRILGIDAEKMYDLEEHIIRLYGSALFATLKANGWLQIPEVNAEDPVRP